MVSQYEHGPDFQTPNEARIYELEDIRSDMLAALQDAEPVIDMSLAYYGSDAAVAALRSVRAAIAKASASPSHS